MTIRIKINFDFFDFCDIMHNVMAEAEGKIFSFDGTDKIRADYLETFGYDGGEQLIEYSTDEFSAVCPFSGLPDIGRLVIRYIPQEKCLELKSLKYYLISFRNVGVYQEKATDIIFNDIKAALQPRYLFIGLDYNIRGGIFAHTEMIYGELPVKYQK